MRPPPRRRDAHSHLHVGLIDCRVYDTPPPHGTGYGILAPKAPCGWALCSLNTRHLLDNGPKFLLCISRRTRRIPGKTAVF